MNEHDLDSIRSNASDDETRFCCSRHQKISGGHTGGATPDPISNSEVKPSRADGTARSSVWESRTLPEFFFEKPHRLLAMGLFFYQGDVPVDCLFC